ncbi:NAD-dependent epimerase/dehydratase [Penicillium digitatum]|uniref:NAD-dependent epimerase/dehydratase n=1 Tax=Penicillium digitatum TaxID=36651 RepID=A0A7T7BJC4_PENDI|nr:NAD-dependent epimerase/dehydratase [Penicillium digitatum]
MTVTGIDIVESEVPESTARHAKPPQLFYILHGIMSGGSKAKFELGIRDKLPTSFSYGSQKIIVETLLSDYSRRGFLDDRSVRLPTVTVRAGKPAQAASSFASEIIREPFHGTFGESRSINLPGLNVSIQQMLDALLKIGGKERRDPVEEKYDAATDKFVKSLIDSSI